MVTQLLLLGIPVLDFPLVHLVLVHMVTGLGPLLKLSDLHKMLWIHL